MLRNLCNLIAIRFKEFYREPEIIFWSMVFPIVLSWLLGVAIGSGGKPVRSVAVMGSPVMTADSAAVWIEGASGGVAARSSYSGEATDLKLVPMMREEALLAMKKGKVSIMVDAAGDDKLGYYFDPRNADAERTWLVLDRAVTGPVRERTAEGDDPSVNVLRLPGTRYIDFLLPGLLAMNLMNSAMWGVGWSLIETRMKKFLRRMAATPMSRKLFLGSHLITRLIMNGIQFIALYLFVYFYFGVEIQGSFLALLLVFISGNLAFSGIAILISSRTGNSRVGNGLINVVTMPMMLLSGIFFSYHNFPEWVLPVVRYLPLTMVADSLRAIFNEGAGLAQVWGPVAALTVMGTVFFYAGSRMFKWY